MTIEKRVYLNDNDTWSDYEGVRIIEGPTKDDIAIPIREWCIIWGDNGPKLELVYECSPEEAQELILEETED